MALLKQKKGSDQLGGAFYDAALTALQHAFLATPDARGAQEALERFRVAADALLVSENTFSARSRGTGPDLGRHLRTPEQFAALRGFTSAKEALLDVNPDIGGRIIRLVTAASPQA
jgi:hypothetical protein